MVDADDLSLSGLYNYARYLRDNDLDARFYEASLWSRVAGNALIVVMTLLAVPFVLGPLRSSGAGSRMLVGLLIGVAYVLLNKTLVNSSSVFELNPVIIGWAPTAALALFSAIGIARVR
jgi:lipopolysaccharide export system permease protein